MKDVKLPEGWKVNKLENLLENRYSGEWGKEDTNNEGIFIIRTTNFTNKGKINFESIITRKIDKKVIEKKKLKHGDIILEKSGGSENQPVGRVVYFEQSDGEYMCNNFTHVFRVDEKKADSKYVMYFLLDVYKKGVTEYFQNKTTGIRNLQMKRYLELNIILPSLQTQKRIVQVLEKAESAIERRKESIKLLDELVKSRFIEMFGDPVTNSKKWNVEVLEKYIDVIGGYAFKSAEFVNEGVPVLKIGNINAGYFKAANLMFWKEDEKLNKYLIKPKDLVISLTGTVGKDDYGNVCIMSDEYKKYYLNQRNAKLQIRYENLLNKYYLTYLLKVPKIKKKLTGINRGVRQANIANKDILKLNVPLPPIELQNQFADFVKQIDKLKFQMESSLKELENNFNSLMQRAFKGELFN